MRIGVIGAGAVGGAIGALLHRAGHDVVVTARGEHLETIQRDGITLDGAWGEHVARVQAATVLPAGIELAIVATKARDAAPALAASSDVLVGIPVVVIQNGLDALGPTTVAAPESDIVGGLATFASSYLSPGRITVTAAGPTYLGVAAGAVDLPARFAASVLADAIPVEVVTDFAGAQWTKLIINQVNALPAVTGLSVQDVVRDDRLRAVLTASMREAVRIGLASGVRFASLQGLGHAGLRLFAAAPLWAGQVLPRLMARRMGSRPNPGSTLQSIRRGQRTEIDSLNGAVVAAAAALGRVAPLNKALVEMVHAVEGGNVFFTPDDVVSRTRA